MKKFKLFKLTSLSVVIICIILIFCFNSTLFAGSESSDFEQLDYTELLSDMGTGWNLGNSLEAVIDRTPYETNWGNPVITEEFITQVKEAGFESIRIPVSYIDMIGESPNYTIDSSWLNRVQEVVDYAYSQDMYVIINIHGDGYSTIPGGWLLPNASDQNTIKDKFSKVWQQIASRFLEYDERLIFESMNEVFDGDWDAPEPEHYANFNEYNQIFVDTVRQTGGNNAARWLLVPGWNTNIDYTVKDFGFEIPTDIYRSDSIPSNEKRLAISVHYYSPWGFCGDTSSSVTQWGESATDPDKVSTWGQEDYMEEQFNMMYTKFVTEGYPFIVGEYGTVDKTNIDSENAYYREYFTNTLCSKVKKYGGIPVYWDNGYNGNGGHAVFERNTGNITQKGIIDSIMDGLETTPDYSPDVVPELITPKPLPEGSFTVDYDTAGGGTINVTITNNLTTRNIEGWTMEFDFSGDQEITNLWNGTYTQDGQSVSVSSADYNKKIAANGGSVSFGFSVSYTGTNDIPAYCVINGSTCILDPTATVSPTSTIEPTIEPTTGPTIEPTIEPTTEPTATEIIIPTETSTSENGYIVSYNTQNDWGGGATVSIVINNNTSTIIENWTLTWDFIEDQLISNIWNASYIQSGTYVEVANEPYNGNITSNGGTVSFGFNITYSNTNTIPSNFELNGISCIVE
ncbi:MAG: cellulase family glycosylhydrolase [Clostridiales bacterium]